MCGLKLWIDSHCSLFSLSVIRFCSYRAFLVNGNTFCLILDLSYNNIQYMQYIQYVHRITFIIASSERINKLKLMNHLYNVSGFRIKYCYNVVIIIFVSEEKENVITIEIREHNRVQVSKSVQAIQSPFLCFALHRVFVYVDPLIKNWFKFRETGRLDDASSHCITKRMHKDAIP